MPKSLCDWWADLIFEDNSRGQIYDYFNQNRTELIEHLKQCSTCKNFLNQIIPLVTILNGSRNAPDFARLVRKMYKEAHGRFFREPKPKDKDGH